MKTPKQLASVVGLILMFTIPAFAGDIEIPGAPPPPASVTTAPGGVQIPGDIQRSGALSGPVTEVALNLLQTVLSIF